MPAPSTKSIEVANILRKRIDRGDYAAQLPGMNVLARELGVNGRTVMRGVEALEAEGVVKRVPCQGTFVTRLRRERTNTIGAVLIAPAAPPGSQLVAGMQSAAGEASQALALKAYSGKDGTQLPKIRDLVGRARVDGLVLWLPAETEREAIAYLQGQNVPCVLVPEPDLEIAKDVHTVSNADSGAAADVMTHLIGLGHRDIAFVGEASMGETVYRRHRYGQYCRSLGIAGLTPRDALNIAGVHARDEVPELDPEGVAALREVTAVFCETDRVAAIVHQACVREGIRIPDDLAVVGYDNIDLARWLNLTTVEQHFEEIGRKAVKLLLDDIEGNLAEPVHLEVTSELIIRGSTRREMA